MFQLTLDEAYRLARTTDPETSHLAAERAVKFRESHGDRIVKALCEHGPMTAHEIAPYVGMDYAAVGKRMHELIAKGRAFVAKEDFKEMTRLTPSGSPARVCVGVA